jgi:thermolysin
MSQRGWAAKAALAILVAVLAASSQAQQPGVRVASAPASVAVLREWDRRIDAMARDGDLRLRQVRDDTLIDGRVHERFDQYHRGVRVFAADVTRQSNAGQIISVFGTIHTDIDLDASPRLDSDDARAIVSRHARVEINPARQPELVVLPLDGGGHALTWRMRTLTADDLREYFVDATTGAIVLEYSDLQTQSAVGRAVGVLGDTKKISVQPDAGRFLTNDQLRPPVVVTYDMGGNASRVLSFLNEFITLGPGDIATDADNDWSDGAVGDAHVYAGWTYDYYFKRFGRRGLDNADIPIRSLVHPVRRENFFSQGGLSVFYANAGYFGGGIMVYGVGLPSGITSGGRTWDFTSGAIDIVAHELTHGVTDYSSGLIYRNESGALNESFSDVMATAIEFFFQPAGDGPMRADYLAGEDIARPGGIRSLANPLAYNHPDHYSRRFLGIGDNGGVHINSGISNHAFYLAIEGGTNRTSGLSVQGVGGANREQIEKVFYRAFVQLLPADATFSMARAATIQAGRDLYGENSAAERAMAQAWTAVGVN